MSSKKDIILTKGIAFRSEDNGSYYVENVKLIISPADIRNIKKAMKFCRQNKFIFSVKVDFDNIDFLDDDDEITYEWRSDGNALIVYENTVYFYSQSQFNAGDQFETEEITLKDLGLE